MQGTRWVSAVVAAVLVITGIFASAASAFPKYNYAFSFGSRGSGNGQFNHAEGIATSPAGDVYVADSNNHRIQKFNSKGEYLSQFGKSQLYLPRDIAIDSKGNFWVLDKYQVLKYDSSTNFVSAFGEFGYGDGQFYYPTAIDVDSKGNIWVLDDGNYRLQEFNSEGKFVRKVTEATLGRQFYPVNQLAMDSKDNIWVINSTYPGGSLIQISPEGKFLAEISKDENDLPSGVTVDSQDQIWVDTYGLPSRISVFNPQGEVVGQVGELTPFEEPGGVFFTPLDFTVDLNGNPWIINSLIETVQRWLVPPEATTEASSNIKGTEATLNGKVNPQATNTTYQFEYGTTTSYGSKAPASPESAGSGTVDVSVSETISGLTPGATYHFRLAATSAAGTVYGGDKTFTTSTAPKNWIPPSIGPRIAAQDVPEKVDNGYWTGGSLVFSYQWRRCNAAGLECLNIASANGETYIPSASDVGFTLSIAVTGTNSMGSETVYSKPTDVVKPLGQITEFALPAEGDPIAISSGPDGRIWYSGTPSGGVGKVSTAGSFIAEYSVSGSPAAGLTWGPGNRIWFAGTYDSVISMNALGSATEYETGGGSTVDVTKGPDNKAWFTVTSGIVGKISSTGVKTEYPAPGLLPRKITAGPDGNLWFTDTGCGSKAYCNIVKMSTEGAITKYPLPVEGAKPWDIVAGPDGNLWFTMTGSNGNGKIVRSTTSGAMTEYTPPGGSSSYPFAITAGPDGRLWYVDRVLSNIGRVTTGGAISTYALPPESWPIDITVGSDGMLWYLNSATNKMGTIVP